MKAASLLFLLLAAAAVADTAGQGAAAPQLTLDPQLYAEALREVQGVPQPPTAPPQTPPESPAATDDSPVAGAEVSTAPGVEDWQAAMRDAGTELADVRLLVLLQRLNPLDPPAARAEDYAAALHLHHLMLAGNARACLELARACRAGQFESGLIFIQSDALAQVLERRAAAFQLPAASLPAPASAEAKGLGASL